MFDYLQKFNKLPKDLREKVSSPVVMKNVNDLENRYGVDLAALVMKVMVKVVGISDLTRIFVSEYQLSEVKSKQLVDELRQQVFVGVIDYLEKKGEGRSTGQYPQAGLKTGQSFELKPEVKLQKKDIQPRQTRSVDLEPSAGPKSASGASTRSESSAGFFFSPKDEEEIRELTKKIDGRFDIGLFNGKIDEKLEEIISQVKINFGSQQLLDRFKQIIKTYLRGIRDVIETKQALMKSFEGGGLGFDSESVDKVLLIAENSIKNLNDAPRRPPAKIKLPEEELENIVEERPSISEANKSEIKLPSLKDIGVRDVDYSFSKQKTITTERRKEEPEKALGEIKDQVKNEIAKQKENNLKKLDTEHELAPPPPAIFKSFLTPLSNNKGIKKAGKQLRDIKTKEEIEKVKIQPRELSKVSGKKRMEDIKYIPRIMDPINELHYMDIINFRRLDPDPRKIIAKIKEKINLLEEEQYSKRIEGIKGWRQSPVNRLYLSIGQQSMGEGKPVEVVIEERKNEDKDYLTTKEFEAIMDLNKELRF